MTDRDSLRSLRTPSREDPLRVLLSACLLGTLCGADGSSYGDYPHLREIADFPNVRPITFCPEDFAFGTPREIPDIEGGNGADVWDGKATVITESGRDITGEMRAAAEKMLEVAVKNEVELAILMDVSAACGSQVIYRGHRLAQDPQYQIGAGVCAELLRRNGFLIISQRDYKSLEILKCKINPQHILDPTVIDHHETTWYKTYFGK